MSKESRLSNSIKNVKTAWICQFCLILIKFVTRRLFTQYVPTDYLGLEGVFSNIMGLLNLADLGIASSIGFALYKPIAEKNEEEIASIMSLFARIYRKIALIIAIFGIALMPFLTILAPETKNLRYTHFIFGLYIISTCLGYIFGYEATLANAYQKYYIYLRNHYFFAILLNVAQVIVLSVTHNYIIYVAVQVLFSVGEGFSISRIMRYRYPLLKRKDVQPLDKKIERQIWTNVKQLSISKIGVQIIASTDNLVMSNIMGLSITGIYGNYVLIISALQAIVAQMIYAIAGSVGNLAVTEKKERQQEIFGLVMYINSGVYVVTSVCLCNLIQPFVAYWLGGKFLMSTYMVYALVVAYYIRGLRDQINVFRSSYGLFSIEGKKTCMEAGINLISSVILAKMLGTIGIVLGTIISALASGMWMEIADISKRLELSKKKIYLRLTGYTVCGMISVIVSSYACNFISWHWYIRLPAAGVISVIVSLILWFLAFGRMKETKAAFEIVLKILPQKNNR